MNFGASLWGNSMEKKDILQHVVLEQLNSNIEKENEPLSLSQGIKKKQPWNLSNLN